MRVREMYYAYVQKESINKGVDTILWKGLKVHRVIYNNTCIYMQSEQTTKKPVATHGHSPRPVDQRRLIELG